MGWGWGGGGVGVGVDYTANTVIGTSMGFMSRVWGVGWGWGGGGVGVGVGWGWGGGGVGVGVDYTANTVIGTSMGFMSTDTTMRSLNPTNVSESQAGPVAAVRDMGEEGESPSPDEEERAVPV